MTLNKRKMRARPIDSRRVASTWISTKAASQARAGRSSSFNISVRRSMEKSWRASREALCSGVEILGDIADVAGRELLLPLATEGVAEREFLDGGSEMSLEERARRLEVRRGGRPVEMRAVLAQNIVDLRARQVDPVHDAVVLCDDQRPPAAEALARIADMGIADHHLRTMSGNAADEEGGVGVKIRLVANSSVLDDDAAIVALPEAVGIAEQEVLAGDDAIMHAHIGIGKEPDHAFAADAESRCPVDLEGGEEQVIGLREDAVHVIVVVEDRMAEGAAERPDIREPCAGPSVDFRIGVARRVGEPERLALDRKSVV